MSDSDDLEETDQHGETVTHLGKRSHNTMNDADTDGATHKRQRLS